MLTESTSSRKNKILVIGPEGAGTLDLVKQILSHHNQQHNIPTDTHATPLCIPLRLDTKYYTADIVLWVDSIAAGTELSQDDIEEWCALSEVVDGFLYVYDRDKPETFTYLKHWTTFLTKTSPNIFLCIANTPSSTTITTETTPPHLDTHKEYCLENGLEFIDIQTPPPDPTESFAERVGFDRIMEALELNMWDGMVRKQANVGQRREGGDGSDDGNAITDLPSLSDIMRTRDMIFGKQESASSQMDDISLDPDADDDDFGRSLMTLRGLRDFGQALPDEERRALAARVALSFGLQLGDEDSERDVNNI